MDNMSDTSDTAEGYDWGENSKQAHPSYPLSDDDKIPKGWNEHHTDVDEIRRRFGIGRFDLGGFTDYETPYADCLVHTTDGRYFGHVGGTNALAVGGKGSGKSTLALHIAQRLMDDAVRVPAWALANDVDEPDTVELAPDAVVWRGQTAASEWLPYKKWTTLHLPAGADIEATWEPNDMRKQTSDPAELADIVRDIHYYDHVQDVNDALTPGTFNVVYPDPSFAGCEEVMTDSDYCPEPVPFTPAWEADEPEDTTPPVHWWFAYLTARLEYGPYDWTSVIFDEAADLAPQGARADRNQTYTKIQTLRKVMAQSRKHYLSLFMFAHHETNVHSKVRRTFDWRVSMPDGTANLCSNNNDNAPVGFQDVPMIADMMSRKEPGYGLFWDETNFTRFRWGDIGSWGEDESRWLKLSLSEPTRTARAGSAAASRAASTDD